MTLLDLPKRVWISRPQMTLHDIPGLLIFVHNLRIGVKRISPLKDLHRRISNFDSSSPTSMVLSKLIENFPTSTVTYQLKLYFPTSARTFQLQFFSHFIWTFPTSFWPRRHGRGHGKFSYRRHGHDFFQKIADTDMTRTDRGHACPPISGVSLVVLRFNKNILNGRCMTSPESSQEKNIPNFFQKWRFWIFPKCSRLELRA